MPLRTLPTEIDELIISHLTQSSLYNVSLTNKYHRTLSEPWLYRDIQLEISNTFAPLQLLMTLLGRRKLAHHVQSFALTSESGLNRSSHTNETERLNERLFIHAGDIMGLIQQFSKPFANTQTTLKWGIDILRGTEVADRPLALILCLATNLERLKLEGVTGWFTATICETRWNDPVYNLFPGAYPLHKLKTMEMSNGLGATILPSMHTLVIKHTSLPQLVRWQYERSGNLGSLHTLEMSHVQIAPDCLERMIALPGMKAIQHLELRELFCKLHFGQQLHDYSFKRLNRTLEAHLPRLLSFKWSCGTDCQCRCGKHGLFDTFKALTQLKELKIDYEYIIPSDVSAREYVQRARHFKELLPDHLDSLHITAVPIDWTKFVAWTCQNDPLSSCIFITATTVNLSLFKLTVLVASWPLNGLCGSHEFEEDDQGFWPRLVRSLCDVGIKMEIETEIGW